MIYTAKTKKAMVLAYNAHNGQLDKGGMPYIFHPFHIAEQMTDEATTIAALLHDVIEDCGMTADDLRKQGIEEEIIDAVEFLSRPNNIDYFEYIKRLSGNSVARAVKLEDLKHNSDLTRLEVMDEKDLIRAEKYKKAIKILLNET